MEKIKIGPFKTWNVEGNLIVLPANSEEGFYYGYVIYIPNTIKQETTLIVEGSNSLTSEKIDIAMKKVYEEATNPTLPIYEIATKLGMPIIYPLFPRWYNGEETIYNHMLSSNSLNSNTRGLKDNNLERVDLQLICMIKNARRVLCDFDIKVDEKVIIDGFSASSKFANRFTLLHPELVKLCIGGGISGTLTLPLDDVNGEKLLWPVGVGNIKELLGEDTVINKEEFLKVRQFYYMGSKDTNDPFALKPDTDKSLFIPAYSGMISSDELRQMYKFIGVVSNGDRWENIQKIYESLDVNVRFKT